MVDLAQVLHLPFALVKLRGKAVLNTRVYSLSNVTACINNRFVKIVSYLYCSNVIMTAGNSVEQAHALTKFLFGLCFFPKIDDGANASFLGWVVAAYSLGQMVASPIFGLWSNYRPRREPLVCSIFINLSANIYYAYAYLPRTNNKFHLLMSRAFVGFGAGDL